MGVQVDTRIMVPSVNLAAEGSSGPCHAASTSLGEPPMRGPAWVWGRLGSVAPHVLAADMGPTEDIGCGLQPRKIHRNAFSATACSSCSVILQFVNTDDAFAILTFSLG